MASQSPTGKVMSRAAVDEATLAEIAQACGVPPDSIEDIYSCTPIQLAMIDPRRSEVFHLVISLGPAADMDRFSDALERVVALNSVLRTRIVACSTAGVGTVQVVTRQQHVTERQPGGDEAVEQFMRDLASESEGTGSRGAPQRLGLGGLPLFSSVFVGRHLVVSIHHAIMDHWSMTAFLRRDVAGAYYGHAPPLRAPFKGFVEHCVAIDEPTARGFWAPRFKGIPAVFPELPGPGYAPCASQKGALKVTLDRIGGGSGGILTAHLPYYCEAAWAITSAIYAGSTSVAYGYVLSGRSTALDGAEDTLGLTIAEVPVQVQVHLQGGTTTVARLVADRAAALRQLQASPALQYGMARIGAVSEAARLAVAACQTLFNIRPLTHAVPSDMGGAERLSGDDIEFRSMQWLRGSFPLQLVFNILDDGVLVEARADERVLPDAQLARVLRQYAHTLRVLTEAPPDARLDDLPLLSAEDRAEIFGWHGVHLPGAKNGIGQAAAAPYSRGSGADTDTARLWIVEPRAPFNLAPIGAVGEVLMQSQEQDPGLAGLAGLAEASSIPTPSWWTASASASGPGQDETRFFRTGDLAKYKADGSIVAVGRLENRVRLHGQVAQLEDIERVLLACDQVADVVTVVRIARGRTQLVALVCLAGEHQEAEGLFDAVCGFARARLPSDRVPAVWHLVVRVPRTAAGALDRAAARLWLKTAGAPAVTPQLVEVSN